MMAYYITIWIRFPTIKLCTNVHFFISITSSREGFWISSRFPGRPCRSGVAQLHARSRPNGPLALHCCAYKRFYSTTHTSTAAAAATGHYSITSDAMNLFLFFLDHRETRLRPKRVHYVSVKNERLPQWKTVCEVERKRKKRVKPSRRAPPPATSREAFNVSRKREKIYCGGQLLHTAYFVFSTL